MVIRFIVIIVIVIRLLIIMASNSHPVAKEQNIAIAVCRICYKKTPTDRDLLTVYCRSYAVHRGHPTQAEILVTWSEQKRLLVAVRPLPDPPRTSRLYTLCSKGRKCPGVVCVSAHSEEELRAWNSLCEKLIRPQNQPLLPHVVTQSNIGERRIL